MSSANNLSWLSIDILLLANDSANDFITINLFPSELQSRHHSICEATLSWELPNMLALRKKHLIIPKRLQQCEVHHDDFTLSTLRMLLETKCSLQNKYDVLRMCC